MPLISQSTWFHFQQFAGILRSQLVHGEGAKVCSLSLVSVRSKASSTDAILDPAERLRRREVKLAERLKDAWAYQNGGRIRSVKTRVALGTNGWLMMVGWFSMVFHGASTAGCKGQKWYHPLGQTDVMILSRGEMSTCS